MSSCNTVIPELYAGSVKQAAVLLVRCRSAGRSDPCTPDSGIWRFHGPKTLARRRPSPESSPSQTWPNIQLRPSHLSIREEQMREMKSVHEPVCIICMCVCVCECKDVRTCLSKSPIFKTYPDWIMQGFNLTIFYGNVANAHSLKCHWKMSWNCFTFFLLVCYVFVQCEYRSFHR